MGGDEPRDFSADNQQNPRIRRRQSIPMDSIKGRRFERIRPATSTDLSSKESTRRQRSRRQRWQSNAHLHPKMLPESQRYPTKFKEPTAQKHPDEINQGVVAKLMCNGSKRPIGPTSCWSPKGQRRRHNPLVSHSCKRRTNWNHIIDVCYCF